MENDEEKSSSTPTVNLLTVDYLPSYSSTKVAVTRKHKRAYGRLLSGINRSLALGARLRRSKWSPLLHGSCLMHITLTTSESSPKTSINDACAALIKRIRRKWPHFEYFKMLTPEGVSGVIHMVARNSEFITKAWLTENWSDTFQATVTWSTQLYGNKRRIMSYLMGYLGHHEEFIYGFSKRWIFVGFARKWRSIFSNLYSGSWPHLKPIPNAYEKALEEWDKLIFKLPPDSYPVKYRRLKC